jgi:hypothetical protein
MRVLGYFDSERKIESHNQAVKGSLRLGSFHQVGYMSEWTCFDLNLFIETKSENVPGPENLKYGQVTFCGVTATELIVPRVKAFPCSSIKARVLLAKVVAGAWEGQAYFMRSCTMVPWSILVIIGPSYFNFFLPTNKNPGGSISNALNSLPQDGSSVRSTWHINSWINGDKTYWRILGLSQSLQHHAM